MSQPPGSPSGQGGQPGPYPYGQPPQPPDGSAAPAQAPQYGQPPYGPPPVPQAAAWQPTPGWSSPGGVPPQLPTKKSRAGLVVGVIAIVVVLFVAGAVAVWLKQAEGGIVTATGAPVSVTPKATAATKASATATATSTVVSPVTCSGSTIDGPAYSATVPSGWSCTNVTMSFVLVDATNDTLVAMEKAMPDPASVCTGLVTDSNNTRLPDTQWGGKPATTVTSVVGTGQFQHRCIVVKGSVFLLNALPSSGTYHEMVVALDALTASWIWK